MIRLLIAALLLVASIAPADADAGWLAEATFRPSAGTNWRGHARRSNHRAVRFTKGYRR